MYHSHLVESYRKSDIMAICSFMIDTRASNTLAPLCADGFDLSAKFPFYNL